MFPTGFITTGQLYNNGHITIAELRSLILGGEHASDAEDQLGSGERFDAERVGGRTPPEHPTGQAGQDRV